MSRGPANWRKASRRRFPLSAHAVITRPVGGYWPDGNPLMWEFVYFPAIDRNSPPARILGLAVPVACAAATLSLRLLIDDLNLAILIAEAVAGVGLVLAPSFGAAYLLRRPYWQPGVVSLLLLGYAVGIPVMFLAQASRSGASHAVADVLDWLTVQSLFLAIGPTVSAVIWLPFAALLYRRKFRG